MGDETRRRLQKKAFAHTASYDAAIATWLSEQEGEAFPEQLSVSVNKAQLLRYGENPHQRGAFYRDQKKPAAPTVAFSEMLQGKELSYNNILDLDAALGLLLEFPASPAAVVIKHNTPCAAWPSTPCSNGPTAARGRSTRRAPSAASSPSTGRSTRPPPRPWPRPSSRRSSPPPTPRPPSRVLAAQEEPAPARRPARRWPARPCGPGRSSTCAACLAAVLVMDRDAVEPAIGVEGGDAAHTVRPTSWRRCASRGGCANTSSPMPSSSPAPTELLAQAGGQTSRVDSVRIAMTRGGERLERERRGLRRLLPFPRWRSMRWPRPARAASCSLAARCGTPRSSPPPTSTAWPWSSPASATSGTDFSDAHRLPEVLRRLRHRRQVRHRQGRAGPVPPVPAPAAGEEG